MAIFSESEDIGSGDITISVILLVCCVTSTSLNPAVFLYNLRRPNTVQRVIYRTLSLIDLITCVSIPVFVVHSALKPTDCRGLTSEERGSVGILHCSRNATTLDLLFSAVAWPCVYLPPILTAVLTSARLYHIKYPLRDPLRKKILYVLLFLSGLQVCFSVGTLLDPSSFRREGSNKVTSRVMVWGPQQVAQNVDIFRQGGVRPQVMSSLYLFLLPFLAQLVGLIATLLTIRQVKITSRSEAAQQAQRDSARITKKILMTNTGSILTMVVYLVYLMIIIRYSRAGEVRFEQGSILSVVWTVMLSNTLFPCLMSAVNPIIFIMMTPSFLGGVELRKGRSTSSGDRRTREGQ